MNLLEIREWFRRESGRHDLVKDDGSNNGADAYINAGQRYLDRLVEFKKSQGRQFVEVSAGTYSVQINTARVIETVWVMNTDSRTELDPLTINEASTKYPQPFPDIGQGRPIYWYAGQARIVPESDRNDGGQGIASYQDIIYGPHYDLDMVTFLPPPDGDYTIEVRGKFYSPKLVNDTDLSEWSVSHDQVLVLAALRAVEIFQRNTQGVRDWEDAIVRELGPFENDFILEETYKMSQMQG